MYEDHVNLLRKIAHQFKHSGMEFEDLMGVANEAYVFASRSFDKSREINFSTFLYTHVKNDLINAVIKNHRRWCERTEMESINLAGNVSYSPETRVCFLSHLRSLSNEAQEVLKMVLSSPSDLLKEAGSLAPKKIRGTIYKKLLKQKWPVKKIFKTFREIKEALK